MLESGGPYELYVIWEISCISVPVGPHGSLLVAIPIGQSTPARFDPRARVYLTIANLHLHRRVALGDILDASHNFRHGCGGCGRATTEME